MAARLLVLALVFAAAVHGGVDGAQGPFPAPSTALGPSTVLPPAPSTETPLAPGPGTSTDCMTLLMDKLSTCLTYVEAGSNLTRPEKGCCQGLADVVNSQPVCLCSLLASKDVYGIQLDRTKSLMLPTACRVQTPPVSLCAAIGIPVPSPEGSATPGAAPVSSTSQAVAGGPVAIPPTGSGADSPTGSGADSSFRSSALALLAGLSAAAAAVF